MLFEEQIVPYKASDLTGRRALVLAPHPDDETLGCGGCLLLHKKAGDTVKVVFLTNGAKGDFSGKDEPDHYIALRRKEAQSACASFGVGDIEFWPFEDRCLADADGAVQKLADLLQTWRPELVYAPSPFEFHPDHRTAAFLLFDAVAISDFDFDIALYEVNQPLKVNCLVDITEVAEEKYEIISVYESQLRESDFTELSRGLNRFRSMTLGEPATHAEAFFLINSSDIRNNGFSQLYDRDIKRLFAEQYSYRNISHKKLRPRVRDEGHTGPMVSVVIPTYNRRDDLEAALKSVLAQKFDDFEIIVVNDGGRNVSDLESGLDTKGKIRWLNHEQRRDVAAARNTGLRAAKGFYVAYLDDDDIYYPDHLETLVRTLEDTEFEFAYTDANRVVINWITDRYVPTDRHLAYGYDFDREKLLVSNYIPTLTIMHRRDLIEEIGFFDETLEVHEDWDMWIRAATECDFLHIPKTTAEFRIRADGETSKSEKKILFADTLKKIHERYGHLVSSPKIKAEQKKAHEALTLEARDSEEQLLINEYRRQHFYHFVASLAKDARVLDLKCGDGFGCDLLSVPARFVVGIDSDSLMVNRAGTRYIRENLRFDNQLPDPACNTNGEPFQVIACFDAQEICENHEPDAFDSIRALLDKNGVLVLFFCDSQQPAKNTGHGQKVGFSDLRQKLENNFSNVLFWQQNVYPVSGLSPCFCHSTEALDYEMNTGRVNVGPARQPLESPRGIIAVASSQPFPIKPGPSYLVDLSASLFNFWKASVDTLESARNDSLVHAENLSAEITDRKQHIENLETLLADQQKHSKNLENEIDNLRIRAASLEQNLAEQQLRSGNLERELQIRNEEVQSMEARIVERDLAVSNLTAELSVMQHSLGWRLVEGFRRRINRLFPESSKRRWFYLKTLSGVKIFLDRGFLALFRHAVRRYRSDINSPDRFFNSEMQAGEPKKYFFSARTGKTEKPCPIRSKIVAQETIGDDLRQETIKAKINFIKNDLLDEVRRSI